MSAEPVVSTTSLTLQPDQAMQQTASLPGPWTEQSPLTVYGKPRKLPAEHWGERNKRGRGPVLAQVRRIKAGEVQSMLLGSGPTREWKVVKECLKQGIHLELAQLAGTAEMKRESIQKWMRRWQYKYPHFKAGIARTALVDADTLVIYFQPFTQ